MRNNLKYAPIALFGFVRLNTLQAVVKGLLSNLESKDTDLHIFIDGPRNSNDISQIDNVKRFCNSIQGFKTVNIYISDINKGLDPSIISGVSKILDEYGRAIILEDDVVPTSNFICYMNQALNTYADRNDIMSISAYGLKVDKPQNYIADVYMFGRSTSWGWAIWKDRWDSIDWDIVDWEDFKCDKTRIKEFNNRGGSDMFSMLNTCMKGGGMWDIRFCYNMYRQNKYSIIPFEAKTSNIGFTEEAIHCKPIRYNRFKTIQDLGIKKEFVMPHDIQVNDSIIKKRLSYQSIYKRIISKIINSI